MGVSVNESPSYKKKDTGNLRRGFTTGACAQAAARAAAIAVATGRPPREAAAGVRPLHGKAAGRVGVVLPDGEPALFEVAMHQRGVCSVVKDAGDDPDITGGARIFARVSPRRDGRVYVDGGEGVGRVTLEGLPVKVGKAAINPVPLRHVRREVRRVLSQGAEVTISVPDGGKLAARTFNSRLGIVDGISILGTTGRVEPWSAEAYRESLLPQLDIARAAGVRRPALVPGGKGERAARKSGFAPAAVVQAGNHFGFMLAAAKQRGFRQVALVGHASKLLKLARGDFNTHSRRSRMPLDVLADSAEAAGWSRRRARSLALLPTTEAAIKKLLDAGAGGALDEGARRVAAVVNDSFGIGAEVMLTDRRGKIVGRG